MGITKSPQKGASVRDDEDPIGGSGITHDTHRSETQKIKAAYSQTSLDDFDIISSLGIGTIGRVVLVKHIHTDRYHAMKVLKKSEAVRLRMVDAIKEERRIWATLSHPFIVTMYASFQDKRNVCLCLEFAQGGELLSHIMKWTKFPNDTSRFYAAQVTMAFEYLHSLNIAYRDLNPRNLLLDASGYIKLTDFGLARPQGDKTFQPCGTPEYVAPEVINKQAHGKAVDWWALGILIFEMLAGYPPFYDETAHGVYQKVLAAKFIFPTHFDQQAKDLISRLLTSDRNRRIGCLKGGSEDVKKHKWFRGLNWAALFNKQLEAPIQPVFSSADSTEYYGQYPDSLEESGPLLNKEQNDELFKDF